MTMQEWRHDNASVEGCAVGRHTERKRCWEKRKGDFGDFGVSFTATVAGRYTRRGDPRDLILW